MVSTVYSNTQREADNLFFTPALSLTAELPHSMRKAEQAAVYYLVSEQTNFSFGFEMSILKATDFIHQNRQMSISQFEIINIASIMFGDSRPLDGLPLEVLKKTARRMLSAEPTKLPRK